MYCKLCLWGGVAVLVGVTLIKMEEEKHNLCYKTYRNTADLGII